jgi:uncharacterized membrane protein
MTFLHRKNYFILSIILLAVLLRVLLILGKEIPKYDESISYLAAACNQAAYQNMPFGVQPVPASEWKQLFQIESPFCLKQIQFGLANHDIHPPLYFWLLHIWLSGIGVTLWSGPLLNVLIFLLSAWYLMKLASHLFDEQKLVTLTLFSYALSPSVLLITVEARQYELLAFFVIFLVWQVIRYLENPSRLTALVLMLAVVGGSLTHYYFVLALVTSGAYAIFHTKSKQRIISLAFLFGVGYLIAFAIHPYLFEVYNTLPARVPEFSPTAFNDRVGRVVMSFSSFLYVFLLLIGGVLLYRAGYKRFFRSISWKRLTIFVIPALISLIIIAQYLAFRTPTHAMGPPKYWSMVWPFLALLPAYAWQWLRMRNTVGLYLYLVPLALAIMVVPLANTRQESLSFASTTSVIVLDHTNRGLVLPLVWAAPAHVDLIVASQETLLQDRRWINFIDENSMYIADVTEGNTQANVESIQRLMQSGQQSPHE